MERVFVGKGEGEKYRAKRSSLPPAGGGVLEEPGFGLGESGRGKIVEGALFRSKRCRHSHQGLNGPEELFAQEEKG